MNRMDQNPQFGILQFLELFRIFLDDINFNPHLGSRWSNLKVTLFIHATAPHVHNRFGNVLFTYTFPVQYSYMSNYELRIACFPCVFLSLNRMIMYTVVA